MPLGRSVNLGGNERILLGTHAPVQKKNEAWRRRVSGSRFCRHVRPSYDTSRPAKRSDIFERPPESKDTRFEF